MKRKIQRKIKPEDKFAFRQPWGGMTPYPPADCKGRRFFKGDMDVTWVDNYYCATICAPNYCKENREYRDYLYRKMKKKED